MSYDVRPIVRLLDEDPDGWHAQPFPYEGNLRHSCGFITVETRPWGAVAVNGYSLGIFARWRLNRAMNRRRARLIDALLSEKAEAEFQRLLTS